MKKNIFLFMMIMLTGTGYSQKAPGKEETIAWLKEKLEKCLEGTYTFAYKEQGQPWVPDGKMTNVVLESINECEFIITYTIRDKNFRAKCPTAIASIKNVNEDSEILPFVCTTFMYSASVINKQNLTTNESGHDNYILGVHLALREDDIHARIEKAMKHLATFCPKKKETF